MDFFEDLVKLQKKGKLKKFYFKIKNGLIYFYLGSLLASFFQNYYESENDPVLLKTQKIRDFLKSQPGFLEDCVNQKIDGRVCRCWVFILSKSPQALLELVNAEFVDRRKTKI